MCPWWQRRLIPETFDYVTFASRTADPTLKAGRLWFRSDLGRLRYSPDGETAKGLAYIPVPRSDLEYVTENVSFSYLAAIDKVVFGRLGGEYYGHGTLTRDTFTDKSVLGYTAPATLIVLYGRYKGEGDSYYNYIDSGASTADHKLKVIYLYGVSTLATESVDISNNQAQVLLISCSGSTIKSLRWAPSGPIDPLSLPTPDGNISATDTTFTDGRFGYMFRASDYLRFGTDPLSLYLLPPQSSILPTIAIIEVNYVGSGAYYDPIRPSLISELKEVKNLQGLPNYLYVEARKYYILKDKGITHEEIETILGYVPQHQVDLASITWGSFDFSLDTKVRKPSPNYIILVKGGNFYAGDEAIKKQVEYAKSKGMYVKTVTDTSRDFAEKVYNELKQRGHDFLATVNDLWYQFVGSSDIEPLAVADFYYREVIDLKRLDLTKIIDIDRTLRMWLDRLEKSRVSNVLKEEAKRKLLEVMKKG